MLTVVVESHIPYVGDSFSGVCNAVILPPENFTAENVRNADALVVRTRTRCNASLLEGSRVRFIATATIGTDHIDLEYCREKGVQVVSAPGCNAPAVAQYVWSSVLRLRNKDVAGLTIGIVGLGHVGSIVARWAQKLGIKVLACDPPRNREHGGWSVVNPFEAGSEPFVSLAEIAAEADIVTFHTPHTKTGIDATHHLADNEFFNSLKRQPIVINAARGAIINTDALLSAIEARKVSKCVIDCWEGEPAIDGRLLELAHIATPHIAGYSIEGKHRATDAVVAATRRFLGVPLENASVIPDVPDGLKITADAIISSYNPYADTEMLKSAFTPTTFEQMRNTYRLRHELGFSDSQ